MQRQVADSKLELELDEIFERMVSERPRDRLPTLRDFDPLRHDIGYRRRHDASRDSMPTLPEIDPLRYDRDN